MSQIRNQGGDLWDKNVIERLFLAHRKMWNWFYATSTINQAASREILVLNQRQGWEWPVMGWQPIPMPTNLVPPPGQPSCLLGLFQILRLLLFQGWQGLWQSCCPQVPHRHSWWLQGWCPRYLSKGKKSFLGTDQNIISPVFLAPSTSSMAFSRQVQNSAFSPWHCI